MRRGAGDEPDTGAQAQRLGADDDGRIDNARESSSESFRLRARGRGGTANDAEFLAAKPGNHVAAAYGRPLVARMSRSGARNQPLRDDLEHLVTGLEPVQGVEGAEAVEIEREDGYGAALGSRIGENLVQAPGKWMAIGEPGQPIRQCHGGRDRADEPDRPIEGPVEL